MKSKANPYAPRALALFVAIGALTTGARAADYPKYRITDLGTPSGVTVLVSTGGRPLDAAGDVVYMLGTDAYLWQSDGAQTIDITTSGSGKSTTTNAFDINASGQVAGWAEFGTNVHAFIWKNDGTAMMDLGALGSPGNTSSAVAINDLAQVAGTSGNNRAFLWKNDGGPMHSLGTLPGGTSSSATALNEFGQVTGWSTTKGTRIPHAFLWKNDGTPMVDLGPFAGKASQGLSINASGQVSGFAWAGVVNNSTYYHAYRWRNDGTAPVDLDKNGGAHSSRGEKINDAGQVIGSAWSTVANTYHAFTWRSNGSAVDLGTLGGNRSQAYDINRAGWVVGASTQSPSDDSSYNAFLWIDNGQGIKNLNDLVDPADPLKSQVTLTTAFAINDAGDIAAVGSGTSKRLYLLRGSLLALDPVSLAFGNRQVGTSSAARTVTVQNRTDGVVAINNIKLAGPGAGQYSYSSNCGSSVVANGRCAIKVTFHPTSKGSKSATLSVNGGGNGLRVVQLSGTGV